jgi:hypothetical protein
MARGKYIVNDAGQVVVSIRRNVVSLHIRRIVLSFTHFGAPGFELASTQRFELIRCRVVCFVVECDDRGTPDSAEGYR